MTITKFDKVNLKTVREDINSALAEVAKKHGIELEIGNISFDALSFRTTLKASVKDGTADSSLPGTAEMRTDFKRFASIFGLSESDLGKTFKQGRKEYTIVGMKPRKRTAPIIATTDGNMYAFPAEMVRSLLVTA